MVYKAGIQSIAAILFLLFLLPSCKSLKKNKEPVNFQYERFKDSLNREDQSVGNDTSNFFDGKVFTPGVDSLNTVLIKVDTLWHRDAVMLEQMDTLIKRLKNADKMTTGELEKLKENIRMLDSFLVNRNDTMKITCREKECPLYAAISKSRQLLFLFIDGVLKDSFPVSTGMKKYTTPDLNVRPNGPILMKYTSRKFPGGNYRGLGNMPYAVFVRGGYAIHGTTPGNFSKLGTVASHGCIRLHPNNARIFYELVKLFGLDNTWVSVRDSL